MMGVTMRTVLTEVLKHLIDLVFGSARSTAACEGSLHFAIGHGGELTLCKFTPVPVTQHQPSPQSVDAQDSPGDDRISAMDVANAVGPESDHAVEPEAGASSAASQQNLQPRPNLQQIDALADSKAGSSSAATHQRSQAQPNLHQNDAPGKNEAGSTPGQGMHGGAEPSASEKAAPPSMHPALLEAQEKKIMKYRLAALQTCSLPGEVTHLAVSWTMPPQFFQQAWRAQSSHSPRFTYSSLPNPTVPPAQIQAHAVDPPSSTHTAVAGSGQTAEHGISARPESQSTPNGLEGNLPDVPGLRKGAAPGLAPTVNLIAESYAWLHVGLEPASGDQASAWSAQHSSGKPHGIRTCTCRSCAHSGWRLPAMLKVPLQKAAAMRRWVVACLRRQLASGKAF